MKAKRVAGTIALGLLLHLVFSNVGADYNLAFTYWMAYTLGCAMMLNYDEQISTAQLALLSLASPFFVVLATYYRTLYRGTPDCWLSGVQCTLDGYFAAKSIAFIVASLICIWAFAHMSTWALYGIDKVFSLTPGRAKAMRARVVWIGTFLLSVFGLFEIIAHGWRK